MTEQEKLIRDIETLLESIRLEWKEVAKGISTKSDALPRIEKYEGFIKELLEKSDSLKKTIGFKFSDK